MFSFLYLLLNTFCNWSNEGLLQTIWEGITLTWKKKIINNSHQKLVSPLLSSGKESSSFLLQYRDVKNLLKPTKVEGDIFTGNGMQAAIFASNSFNVSLLINIKRTMRSRCLPAGSNVEERRIVEKYWRSDLLHI